MSYYFVRLLLVAESIAGTLVSYGQNSDSKAVPLKQTYQEFALGHGGDAARGKALFANEKKAACVLCHTVDGSSAKAGPDLSAIGDKFPRRELIRSILEPSSTIAIGYGTTIIEKKSGELMQGVVKQATDEWVELMGIEGKPVRIATAEIKEQHESNQSLMPDGLENGMTLQEFTDLVTYLESLKANARATSQAFTTIPPCARVVTLSPFFDENIKLKEPTWFGQIPGSTDRFVVLEHAGKSWVIEKNANGDTQTMLVDLSGVVRVGGATGLLGLAFHPKFRDNRKYYLVYHVVESGKISSIIAERQFAEDFKSDSGLPERQLLKIASTTQDHNGGGLEFGPDGFLYIGMGDTGPQRDPQGHGQDMTLLLGKMLRIDVDHPTGEQPYAIPADNPFRDKPNVRPEIWAYGFREPWRYSFDSATGDLWVGDVGQDRFEEVAIVRAGENHGWNIYEGVDAFSDRYRHAGEKYIPPVLSYSHRIGVSVTGGCVYRGKRAPQMQGWYVFADFESRRIWALAQKNRTLQSVVEIGRAPTRVTSFGQDSEGELYFTGFDSGVIYRLELDHVDPTPLEAHVLAETSENKPIEWRYTLETPSEEWQAPDFNDATWTKAPGGFGTEGTPGAVVHTDWRTDNIWLRREFTLPEDFKNDRALSLRLHHDEDAEIYLNGIEAARLPRWTSSYVEVPVNTEAARALHPGVNLMAIHCHQVGGGQYIDAGLIEFAPRKSK